MTLPLFLRPYFGTAGRTLLTVCSLLILYSLAAPVWRWAIADAVWTGDAQACRAANGSRISTAMSQRPNASVNGGMSSRTARPVIDW